MKTKKVLKVVIVEDDLYYNKALTKYIQTICNTSVYPEFNFEILSYLNAHDCIEELDDETNIMVLDYYLINKDEDDILTGADIVKEANEHCDDCHIIMISAQESPHNTSELLKMGVFDYVDKNVNSKNRLGAVLQRLINDKFRKPQEVE
ncbi:MAG: response regulator [Brumimicrobium sp.]